LINFLTVNWLTKFTVPDCRILSAAQKIACGVLGTAHIAPRLDGGRIHDRPVGRDIGRQ
jgi:hypothetical protein